MGDRSGQWDTRQEDIAPGNSDTKIVREILRAVEMFRREVRMRNKVELYRAISSVAEDNFGWVQMARVVNEVYAEMYVLSKPRGDGHGRDGHRSAD